MRITLAKTSINPGLPHPASLFPPFVQSSLEFTRWRLRSLIPIYVSEEDANDMSAIMPPTQKAAHCSQGG